MIKFDPSQPFEVVDDVQAFDPSQPYEEIEPESNILGAAKDIGTGLLRAPLDAAASAASIIDDPYTRSGMLDPFIESRRKSQEEYINAPGSEEIALPGTSVTRGEVRGGMSSLGYSGAAMGASFLPRAAGAAIGAATGSSLPLAGTLTGAVIGWLGGAGAAGAASYQMDTNNFIREYRTFLESKTGKEITDEEFATMQPVEVAEAIKAHGLHEAGWEGIGNMIERGAMTQIFKGGGLSAKALKGLASFVGFELGSETATQIGQTNAEVDIGMRPESQRRSFTSPEDIATSAREVLPATVLLAGVGGGGAYVAGKIVDIGKAQTVDDAINAAADAVNAPAVETPIPEAPIEEIIQANNEAPKIYRDEPMGMLSPQQPAYTDAEAQAMERAAMIRNTMAITPESQAPSPVETERTLAPARVQEYAPEVPQGATWNEELQRQGEQAKAETEKFKPTAEPLTASTDTLIDTFDEIPVNQTPRTITRKAEGGFYGGAKELPKIIRQKTYTTEKMARNALKLLSGKKLNADEYDVFPATGGWQIRTRDDAAKQKAMAEYNNNLPEDIRDAVIKMESDISQGEVGGNAYNDKSGTTQRYKSTNPDYIQLKTLQAYDKKHGTSLAKIVNKDSIAKVISAVRSGKELTGNNRQVWDYVKEQAANLNKTDTELVSGQEADRITKEGIDIGQKRTVVVGDLNQGDKVVVENKGIPDVVEHKGFDEEGNIILEDGKRFTVDQFDKIDIYGEKKAGKRYQPIKWSKPTKEQLKEEWDSETLDTMFFMGYPKEGESEKYRDHWLDNIDKFSSVEKITKEDLPRQLYVTTSQEQLAENIKHMNKDVPGISELLKSGNPAMPIVIREDGKLKILGGRTRASLAAMGGKDIEALVIDKDKMGEIFYPLRRAEFLDGGYGFFSFEDESTWQGVIDYLEGKRNDLPKFKHDIGEKDLSALSRHLGIKRKELPSKPSAVTAPPEKARPANNERIAEINRELNNLQKQYDAKSAKFSKAGMVPPSIKSSALSGITKKMDKLDAELSKLQEKARPVEAKETPPSLTKEQNKGSDVKYSRAPKSTNTAEQVTAAISKSQRVRQLLKDGRIKVVEKSADIPTSATSKAIIDPETGEEVLNAAGYVKSTDTIYLSAEAIPSGQEESYLAHESWHRAEDKGGLDPLLGELERLEKMAGKGGQVAEWFTKARESAQVDKGTPQYIEEIGAYAVQNYEASPNIIKRWVDKLIAKVRAAIFQTFGVMPKKLDPAFLREIALSGLRGNVETGGSGTVFSRAEIIKQAKAFYSKLAEVSNLKFSGMKAQGVENFLLKQGVKKIEIEATGLKEWLAGKKPADKVTKQELLDFVKANTVELEDVVLGEGRTQQPEDAGWYVSYANGDKVNGPFSTEDAAEKTREKSEQYVDEPLFVTREKPKEILPAHFPEYQEPGAEEGSYREMFVTAPDVPKRPWNEVSMEMFGKKYADLTVTQQEAIKDGSWQDGHTQYQDIKNPIVRIRFNTRTDTQGRSILFIEEMQGPSKDNQEKMPSYLKDNIYNLGVKRVLAYARENGFDGVSWTTGEMQANRYDLSKQVDKIKATPEGRGDGYTVSGYKDGRMQFRQNAVAENDLSNWVGKDLAKKIIESNGGEFFGVDLRVGGEGLKQLYDATLPKMLEAYGKGKVGETYLGGDTVNSVLVNGEWLAEEGLPKSLLAKAEERKSILAGGLKSQFIPITDKTPGSYTMFSRMAKDFGITAAEAKKQYDDVVTKFKGTDGWMKAPNGEPTKLNERQWVQVRTPAFKEWFGDWEVNEVLEDENMEPMVVYHGTEGIMYLPDENKRIAGKLRKEASDTEIILRNKYGKDEKGGFNTDKWKSDDLYKKMNSLYHEAFVLERDQWVNNELVGDKFDSNRSGDIGVHFTANPRIASKFSKNNGAVYSAFLKGEVSRVNDIFSRYQGLTAALEELKNAGVINENDVKALFPVAKRLDNKEYDDQREWGMSDGVISFWKKLNKIASKTDNVVLVYENEVEGGGDSYVVFSPNQIKSAIGNTGQFSKATDDIRYSRVAPKELDAIEVEMKDRWIKGKTDISRFDRMFSTIEKYAEKVPVVGRYWNVIRHRTELKFQYENAMLKIGDIDAVKQWGDLSNKDQQTFSEYVVKADAEFPRYQRRKAADGTWTAYFPDKENIKALGEDESAQALFDREHADNLKDGMRKPVADAIRTARMVNYASFKLNIDALNTMQKQAKEAGVEEPTIPVAAQGAKFKVTKKGNEEGRAFRLFPTIEEAKEFVGERKNPGEWVYSELEDQQEHKVQQLKISEVLEIMGDIVGNYFPRVRKTGDYILRAYDKNGKEKYMKLFDAPFAPEGENWDKSSAIETMKKYVNFGTGKFQKYLLGADDLHGTISEMKKKGWRVEISENTQLTEDVFEPPHLLVSMQNLLDSALESAPKDQQDAAEQLNKIVTMEIGKIFKMRGSLSSRLKRKPTVIAGYETDAIKAVISHVKSIAGGLAKRETSEKAMKVILGRDISWPDYKEENEGKTFKDYLAFVNERRIDPGKQREAYGAVMANFEWSMRNQTKLDRVVGTMKGLATLKYLGFRLSSPAVNMTNMLTGVPAAMHANGISFAKAAHELRRASTAYVLKRSAGDARIFDYIASKGWDAPQFNQDAAGFLQSQAGKGYDKVMSWAMFIFGVTEKFNRAATISAAYRALGGKSDVIDTKIMEKARDISDEAHGVYQKETLPEWAMGEGFPAAMARVGYTFTKFTHNYLLNLKKYGFDGQDRKAATWLLVSPAILSGVSASAITPIIMAIAKAMGEDEPEEDFYKWVEENTGIPDRMTRQGIAGAFGIDIRGSLGVRYGLPTTIKELLGAPYSVVEDVVVGSKKIASGEVMEGIEKIIPSGIGAPLKALREYSEGITTESNQKVFGVDDTELKGSGIDAAIRAATFNPARLAAEREKIWHGKEKAKRYSEMKGKIYSEMRKYLLQKNRNIGDWAEILMEVDDYNRNVMDQGEDKLITDGQIKSLIKKMRVLAAAEKTMAQNKMAKFKAYEKKAKSDRKRKREEIEYAE